MIESEKNFLSPTRLSPSEMIAIWIESVKLISNDVIVYDLWVTNFDDDDIDLNVKNVLQLENTHTANVMTSRS